MPYIDACTAPQHNLAFLVEGDVQGEVSLLIGEDDIHYLAVLHLRRTRVESFD